MIAGSFLANAFFAGIDGTKQPGHLLTMAERI